MHNTQQCSSQRSGWLENSREQMQLWLTEYITASIAIIRTLLITERGIKFSSDDRPRPSWRAPATQRRWPPSWPQNSCSGPKHLRPQRVKQIQASQLKIRSENVSVAPVTAGGEPSLAWAHTLPEPQKILVQVPLNVYDIQYYVGAHWFSWRYLKVLAK